MRVIISIFLALILFLSYAQARADIPRMINFQGVLKDTLGSPVPDGNYSMTFRIYDASGGGTVFWQEGKLIPVVGGLFTTLLGSASPIPESVFADTSRWLGIQIGGDPEISPRTRLSAISYAYIAFFTLNADLLDGQDASDFATSGHSHVITSADIQNGTIVNADISNSANIAPTKISGTAWTSSNDTSGSGLNADLLDGLNSTDFLSTASDFGRSGVAANLYEGGSTLTNKYVNDTGPDSVISTSGTAFLGKVSGSSSSPLEGIRGSASNTSSGPIYGGYFTTDTSGTGTHIAVFGEGIGSSASTVTGVHGIASNSLTGPVYGGRFQVSADGTGIHTGVGVQSAGSSSLPTYGYYGQASNSSSGDVYGGSFLTTDLGTGVHYGVTGSATGSSSSRTVGSYGAASNSSSGATYGGYFVTTSDGTGNHYGVYDSASGAGSASTYGTYGIATNTSTGNAFGGYFSTSSGGTGSHYAVYGDADGASSSPVCGALGYATNTSTGPTYGGYFVAASPGTGNHFGVYDSAVGSGSATTYGTYSVASNTSSGFAIGGQFSATPSGTGPHYGVTASAVSFSTSTATGLTSFAQNTSTGGATAGHFQASSAGTGTHYGVYAIEIAGGSGAAVYASGDMIASGAKPAVVKTAQGHRLLYAMESPEIWFEDFGEGQLVNGQAHVELDALFLETVTINPSNPMKVFIQLNDPNCNGVAAIKGTTGFEVKELQNGTSNASFDYRILAKRKGYETQRLMQTDVRMDDPNLYPELWDKIEKERQERQVEMEKSKIQN